MLTFVIFCLSLHAALDGLGIRRTTSELSQCTVSGRGATHTQVINKLGPIADLHLKLRSLIPQADPEIVELKLQVKISS